MKLAPIYDFGSTFLPQLSDLGMEKIMSDNYEMCRRCLVFPSASLFLDKEKTGKVGYYDMLASGFDSNCTEAVLRIVPRIDMDKIFDIIEKTPLISTTRKNFYMQYINLRKRLILDRVFYVCKNKNFDQGANYRLTHGIGYTEDMLKIDLDILLSGLKNADYSVMEKLPSLQIITTMDKVKCVKKNQKKSKSVMR